MHCRNCGSALNNKAEMCVKCGCRPLNGNEYCQECGVKTTDKQEMCIRCGCMLVTTVGKSKGIPESILESINIGNSNDGEINLNFSSLSPYYQREFQKIYNSGETYKGKFNICAFLFGGIWALTKGCWLPALISFALSVVTAGIGGLVYWFIFGFRGTYMHYCSYVKGKQSIV